VRAVLAAPCVSFEEAKRLSRMHCGKAITKQTFCILPKIREVDGCITPELQERVWEVHPELCFWALNDGQAMRTKKSKKDGQADRRAVLRRRSPDLAAALNDEPPPDAKADDVLDALVAAYTAECRVLGRTATLPELPPVDIKGLRMEMVYPTG
jgi:predicted RNase H-like nuclease